MKSFPFTRDLVLIGGGHTHALVLKKWGMNPLAGARLTLINPAPTAAYSGMLPGFLAGHYTEDELNIDLVKLARFAGARLILGAAHHIDRDAQMIHVEGRPPIAYDTCSIDIGITSHMPSVPGFLDHAIPAKPLTPFARAWDHFRNSNDSGKITVIGGGVAGVEVAMAMQHAMPAATVQLFDRGDALTHAGPRARARLLETLAEKGIKVTEHVEVTAVEVGAVVLSTGEKVASDFTVGAAGALPFEWVSNLGLDVDKGSIIVSPTLQSSDPNIFAVGDCAHMSASPRPKAGVFAVRQAPVLAANLKAHLSGGRMRHYTPQSDYLKLISMGGKEALAAKHGITLAGPRLWKLKDHIDRKFMDQFDELPDMPMPELPRIHALGMKEALGDKPMCAGCGSKVGKSALQTALSATSGGDGDDAATLNMDGVTQVLSTDHLRAFALDPVVMTKVAATHALGDVWAMGATPQAALATLILPEMSEELQNRTVTEIMSAAAKVIEGAGAKIVGGHTSLGSELTVGFSVTGIAAKPPITLGGAEPGMTLILTQPIGTGVILAAEMAKKATGADVANTHAVMMQGQAEASRILRNARAMTDVTGFGLLGHLWGICEASAISAEVTQSAIPILQGAAQLSDAGVRSTLFPANVAAVGNVVGQPIDLLFDPQTAGGLLAAVPAREADETLAALIDAGYEAAIIGQTGEGPPQITIV